MSSKYLDLSGMQRLVNKIKAIIPTKTSQLTNDSGFGDITGVTAGTGLTGGGTSGDVTLNVSYGTTATTACAGNDSRLSDARTPTSHATSATTYGVGTTANYGHCKTINDLTQSSYADGEALSAYQGYLLNQYSTIKNAGDLTLTNGTPTTLSKGFYKISGLMVNGTENTMGANAIIYKYTGTAGDYICLFESANMKNNGVIYQKYLYANGAWTLAEDKRVTYSTTDLTAGTSALTTGSLYFVYE